jgi:hypothetical protein
LGSAVDFFERAAFRLGINLLLVQVKQVTGQFAQGFEFAGADVGSVVLESAAA